MKRLHLRLLLLPLLLAACSDGSSTPTTNPDLSGSNPDLAGPPTTAQAKVRIVHAAVNAGPVDITAGGNKLNGATPLSFGQKTGYLSVPAATAISATVLPTAPGAQGIPITIPALAANSKTTIFAVGDAATSGATGFAVYPVTESFPSSGVNLVVVHAAADAPAVGLRLPEKGPAPTTAGLAYQHTASLNGVDLTAVLDGAGNAVAGIYAGTAAPLTKVTQFTIPSAGLTGLGSTNIFVVAAGALGKASYDAEGFQLFAFSDSEATTAPLAQIKQDPEVYALHAGLGAPAVEIYAGSDKLGGGPSFSYGTLAGPIFVAPSTTGYSLKIFAASAAGAGTPALEAPTGPLAAGERYLAIVSGELGATNTLALSAVRERFVRSEATNGRVRLVHASSKAPASVNVGPFASGSATTLATTPPFAAVAYKAASSEDGVSLPPATYTLGISASPSLTAAAKVDAPVASKARAFAIAIGNLAFTGTEPLQVVLIDTTLSTWAVAATANASAP